MENNTIKIALCNGYLYFLVMGALVMWMAVGFSMLEAAWSDPRYY